MDTRSRCNMGFPDDDEDDGDDFGKEASSHKELVVETVGGNDKNNNSADQKPSTSRSKHSATEQRWRSRINDRFRILRDLMPHGDDQKKDKASVLLEVIGYIQFLQAKVQKYELSYPGLSPDSAKLMLWKTSNTHGENIVDPVKHNIALHPLASFFLLMELFLLQGLCQTHQVWYTLPLFTRSQLFLIQDTSYSAMSYHMSYSYSTNQVSHPLSGAPAGLLCMSRTSQMTFMGVILLFLPLHQKHFHFNFYAVNITSLS